MENIDWQHLLFAFDGRINRAKFWLGLVIVVVVVYGLFGIGLAVDSGIVTTLAVLVAIASIWPSIAIQVKRWHDRDKSGWWWFIGFIPFIGPIWVLVECGFLPGTDGPNNYGDDPLAA